MNQGVSKGNALQILLPELNIPREEVAVFGNGLNDVSMFEVAGYSVAMNNSPDEVKRQANYVTKSNVEDGVAHVLQMLYGC